MGERLVVCKKFLNLSRTSMKLAYSLHSLHKSSPHEELL